jgi:hypothetical protein
MCRNCYQRHYISWKKACQKNGSLKPETESVLPPPKWEWKGDEQSLVDEIEKAEARAE